MRKKTIKIDIPELSAVPAGLTIRERPQFHAAVLEGERALETAQTRMAEGSDRIEELREAVARGAAPVSALEQAIIAHRAMALTIEPLKTRLQDARAALEQERIAARRRVIEQAREIRDELQREADKLTPVLDELRELERALDRAVIAAGDNHGVTPLTWPQSVEDEAVHAAGFRAAAR